ncbi:lectin, putative [Leishmania tarentolae]|uniref:Lectin, putative n=1 Tax=Leishmania tarentolae TaxID=5689 RepID=A0A640KGS1_LEITA|nr:lectin, putative [Leishmania tarentolae]
MLRADFADERRGLCRSRWVLAVCAVVALAISGGLLATARAVPSLTPAQKHRGVTAAIGHHSFAPPLLRQYYGDDELPHWSISGSSVITDEYVRLTADQRGQTGHLWNTEPLDMDAFEVVVGFRVYRPMGGYGADGFGVWVAQPPRFHGPLFGRQPTFNGFGILFDSFDNDNRRDNPMVSLVYNDGSTTKRFTPEKDFMGETVESCIFNFREVSTPLMATMRMVYFKGELRVLLSRDSENTETECFRATNVPLPEGRVYLSLSAQTGDVSEIHDILFVHLSPLEAAKYDHDVHQTIVPANTVHDAQLYNNEAMTNRQMPEGTQETQPAPQDTQPAPQDTQPAPQDTQPAPQDTQPAQQNTQPAQQNTQPAPQNTRPAQEEELSPEATVNMVEKERRRIEELERKLKELQDRNGYRSTRRTEEDDVEEFEEYDDDDDNRQRRTRRVRRARTPRRNRADYEK